MSKTTFDAFLRGFASWWFNLPNRTKFVSTVGISAGMLATVGVCVHLFSVGNVNVIGGAILAVILGVSVGGAFAVIADMVFGVYLYLDEFVDMRVREGRSEEGGDNL